MSNQIIDDFDALCKRVAASATPTLGEDALEPLYEEVLLFLESHLAYRAELAQRIIDTMRRYRFGRDGSEALLPSTAIAYSMHVLRWSEVLAFAEQENQAFYAPKMATLMADIMAAYNDDWEDRDFFKRFQNSR